MSQAMMHQSEGESHGTFASYIVGFILAAILTVAAFAAVLTHALSPNMTVVLIAALAVVQIFVHVIYFLHMNGSSSQSWNRIAFFFTILSVIILVGGTMCILYEVNLNMMSR